MFDGRVHVQALDRPNSVAALHQLAVKRASLALVCCAVAVIRRCLAVASLTLLVACSPDEPVFLAAPQGSGVASRPTATVASTVEGQPSPAATDVHRVPALTGAPPPSSNGNLGSGCSPNASADQPIDDGLWAAFVDQRQPLVVIDLVCLDTSFEQSNVSGRQRQNPPGSTMQVFDATGPVDPNEWLASAPDDALYWIAVNDGQVTSVEAIPA